MKTLLDLAQQFDRLDPEADWKERIALGEQMKAALGDRAADFERRHDRLVKKGAKHASPAVTTLEQMRIVARVSFEVPDRNWWTDGPLPAGYVEEILFERGGTQSDTKLATVFHGAWNLLGPLYQGKADGIGGFALPVRVPVHRQLPEGIGTHISFSSITAGTVTMWLLFGAAPAPGTARAEQPAQAAAGAATAPTAAPPAPAPPLTEEEQLKKAATAYRLFKTLSLQAQVGEDEIKEASLAWQEERNAFSEGTPASEKLQQAMEQIDAEIAEARRRPVLHPHQLPGAIRVPEAK